MYTSESPPRQDAVEKMEIGVEPQVIPDEISKVEDLEDDGEVFKSHTGHAEYRSLGR